MGELGTEVLNAMRDQGWLVIPDVKSVLCESPNGTSNIFPIEMFQSGNEQFLRAALLVLIIADGLQWPWPPDHREEVNGEVPRSGG